jgi:anti-anti-sigma factor
MEIKQSKTGEVATLFLDGRFDFNSHRSFKEAYAPHLADTGVKTLEVNLAHVAYLDSSALGMLLMLRERGEGASKKVVLCNPSEIVAQILDIANFNKLFPIVRT